MSYQITKDSHPYLEEKERSLVNELLRSVYNKTGTFLRNNKDDCYKFLCEIPPKIQSGGVLSWIRKQKQEPGYSALHEGSIREHVQNIVNFQERYAARIVDPAPASSATTIATTADPNSKLATPNIVSAPPMPVKTPAASASAVSTSAISNADTKRSAPAVFDEKNSPAKITCVALQKLKNLLDLVPAVDPADQKNLDAWKTRLGGFIEAAREEDGYNIKDLRKWLKEVRPAIEKRFKDNAEFDTVWQELNISANLEEAILAKESTDAIASLVEVLAEVKPKKGSNTDWGSRRDNWKGFLEDSYRDTSITELYDFLMESKGELQEFLKDCKDDTPEDLAAKNNLILKWQALEQALLVDYLQKRKALGEKNNSLATLTASEDTKPTVQLVELFRDSADLAGYTEQKNEDGSIAFVKGNSKITISPEGNQVSCGPEHYELVVKLLVEKGFKEVKIKPNSTSAEDIDKLEKICEKAGLRVLKEAPLAPPKSEVTVEGLEDKKATVPTPLSTTPSPTK